MTDHAAEARDTLDMWTDVPFPDNDDQERARQYLAEAQVHATLALAEEQRTANLISMFVVSLGEDRQGALYADILARLGLTPTTPNQEQNR